jgi:galactonate dehydratase
MRITKMETFLANAGLRNYLFVRLTTDTGLTGIGEASLEWQEQTVRCLLHEWVEHRLLGADPFDIEVVIGGMIRDQYQGGATIMTAISSVEVAMWDIIGKACGQPVYKLLGGRAHERLPAYANGWYGGLRTPAEYATEARKVIDRGYHGLKFDPFGTAWKTMSPEDMAHAEALVAAVRGAVGDTAGIMIEAHGRLSVECAIQMGYRLAAYHPAWYEEPVTPNSLDLLKTVKDALTIPIAAGERLYTMQECFHLIQIRAADVLQIDPSHCGGLLISKKIAAMAEAQDIAISPHCSIGPVALCAALHLDWATPNALIQESFAEYDVPWRHDFVYGWNPLQHGEFLLPEEPGLGIELNTDACAAHPYQAHSFPSLWDNTWLDDFTQCEVSP